MQVQSWAPLPSRPETFSRKAQPWGFSLLPLSLFFFFLFLLSFVEVYNSVRLPTPIFVMTWASSLQWQRGTAADKPRPHKMFRFCYWAAKMKKKRKRKIASKNVDKADGRDKEREEGRKEGEKGKTGCVRGEPARFCYSHCSNFILSLCSSNTRFEEAEPPHMYRDITNTSKATVLHTMQTRSFGARTRLKKMLKNPSRILPAPLRTSRSHTASWTDRFRALLPLIWVQSGLLTPDWSCWSCSIKPWWCVCTSVPVSAEHSQRFFK